MGADIADIRVSCWNFKNEKNKIARAVRVTIPLLKTANDIFYIQDISVKEINNGEHVHIHIV